MALPTLPLSPRTSVAITLAAALLGAGLFVLGRETTDTGGARADGFRAGVRAGRAQGVQEGRSLQQPVSASREAFDAGYAAGANDVFGGYDGGWYLGRPYVITLARGSGAVTYRIDSRELPRPAR